MVKCPKVRSRKKVRQVVMEDTLAEWADPKFQKALETTVKYIDGNFVFLKNFSSIFLALASL